MPAKITSTEFEVCVKIILKPEECFLSKEKTKDDKTRDIFDTIETCGQREENIEKRVDRKMAFEKMSEEAKETIRAIFGESKSKKANDIAESAFTQKRIALPTGKKIIKTIVPSKRKQKRVLEEVQWFCRNFL